eukprot:5869910-Prorocentrum_lima.AAC.1
MAREALCLVLLSLMPVSRPPAPWLPGSMRGMPPTAVILQNPRATGPKPRSVTNSRPQSSDCAG